MKTGREECFREAHLTGTVISGWTIQSLGPSKEGMEEHKP